ncbi:hypothetical protein MSG28_012599 [Choristoneura fumiferana]|uniref:Uncharacterized protein n=1 Tax=Choristoneura fumiferana TaxID=7141 RepID=A0ACC0JH96_CHOFU|nr:hypothetical protein MSG28_012599 [Choristoneura fumiferana]
MEVDDGPMYLKTAKTEQEACEKTWWLALLMVGNYVHTDAMTTSFLSAGVGITLIGVVLSTGVLCFTYHVMGPLAWVYLTLDRTIFAVALLIVIVFCTYGDVPLINSFLSWAPFRPLSRLSYGLYVFHIVLLYRSKTSLRDPVRGHYIDAVVETTGLTAISLVLSLVVWLLFKSDSRINPEVQI